MTFAKSHMVLGWLDLILWSRGIKTQCYYRRNAAVPGVDVTTGARDEGI